jgi:hypothetical protein
MLNLPHVVYSPNTRNHVEPGEKFVLETLAKAPLAGWTIYEQPNLNGDKPDIVMVNPWQGVIIIEIKDYQINTSNYRDGAKVKGTNGHWIQKTNPADQVNRYRDEILQFCSTYFIDLLEEHHQNRAVFGIVETAVYFHHASAEDGKKFCGNPTEGRAKMLDRTHLDAIQRGDWVRSGLKTLNPNRRSMFTSQQLARFVRDLETWLQPSTYQLEGARPITLTKEQRKLAESTPGLHRRLRGVAGSGKSLVLATRASKLLEENQRVLVVPYNITLKHYLRDLINIQFTGSNRKNLKENLVIRHFHDLLLMIAFEYDIKLENSWDSPDELLNKIWPAQVLEHLKKLPKIDDTFKFDAILVDEGQDYCREWVELLLLLLTDRDEFLIVYDNVQDIYDRKAIWIEDSTQVKGLRFHKIAHLNYTRRVPALMIRVAKEFAELCHLPKGYEASVPSEFNDLFATLEWRNKGYSPFFHGGTIPLRLQVHQQVIQFMEKGVSPDDITILVTNQDTGLDIVRELKSKYMRVCHVFDETGDKKHKERKLQKWKFQPGTGKIKVCTVHSFKGWESTHLILVLDYKDIQNAEPLIYVALTRLKHSTEGAESHFVCLNFNRSLEYLKDIFDKCNCSPIKDGEPPIWVYPDGSVDNHSYAEFLPKENSSRIKSLNNHQDHWIVPIDLPNDSDWIVPNQISTTNPFARHVRSPKKR